MYKTNRYSMVLESLAELAEERKTEPAALADGLPALSSVLAEAAPLPPEALFLGMAEDGLPALLNLYDPLPGAVLLTGDSGCGKTRLLQMLARAAETLHPAERLQYGVATRRPEEWSDFQGSPHNSGIWRIEDCGELLQSLSDWAHGNRGDGQFFLLLIDDLGALIEMDETTRQNLRWLLLRGASRRAWTFATQNASRALELGAWLDFFRTRLFGHIENEEDARIVAGGADKIFRALVKGVEFTFPEGDDWLNMWIPALG